MENLKKNFSNFLKDYDPSKKYIRESTKTLDEIIENINIKTSWNLKEAKHTLDYLYNFQRKHFNDIDDNTVKKIKFYHFIKKYFKLTKSSWTKNLRTKYNKIYLKNKIDFTIVGKY